MLAKPHQLHIKHQLTPHLQLPDHIHGDLDSLRPDVRAFYSSHNVPVTQDPDQYSTDFGKALKLIRDHMSLPPNTNTSPSADHSSAMIDIVILGSIGGRLDHGLGLLHELGREHDQSPDLRLWLVSECSVSFILPAGRRSVIQVVSQSQVLGKHVGVVPLYGEAVITTKGLEWDVEGWRTGMGGQVSTCNRVLGNICEVETDGKVLFTVERVMFCQRW